MRALTSTGHYGTIQGHIFKGSAIALLHTGWELWLDEGGQELRNGPWRLGLARGVYESLVTTFSFRAIEDNRGFSSKRLVLVEGANA